MRINKLSKSNSFDLYTQTLSNFLIKKEAQEKINKLVKLASGLSRLFDLMVGGSRTITRGVDTAAPASRMANNIRSGDLYQEIQGIRRADGSIDTSHANYATVLGKLTDEIETGSRALAEAFVDSGKFSTKMIELFFGSQDDLAKLFELAYINKYKNSSSSLSVVGEFPEILSREVNLATGLEAALPVLKDENLNLLNEAITRSSVSGLDFLKTEPEDLAQLRSWLDADPRDVSRIVEESRDVTRVDTPDDITTIRDPEAPDGVLLGRRYTNEEIDDIIRRVADEASAGNVERVEALRQELTTVLRQINDDMASLETRLRDGAISQADYDRLARALREQGVKIESSTGGFIAKLKAAGASVATIMTFTNLAKAAGILAAGAVIIGGYQYLLGDSPSTPAVDPSETGGTREDGRVTIDPQRVEVERAFGDRNQAVDHQAIQDILSDPTLDQRTLEFITNKYRKDKAYKLPQPFDGMEYVFMTDKAGGLDIDDPVTLSANLDLLVDALNDRRKGLPIYEGFLGSMESPQHALNEAAEEILEKGLYRKRRSRRYQMGRGTSGRRGISGFADKPVPREVRRRMRRQRRRANEINEDRLQKLSHFKEISLDSINNHSNNDTNMLKKADEVSKSYTKDAVKGLDNEDKNLREYFTGLGRLYDAESEKRNPDYEELYKLHNETGRDLTLSAHPKAIRVSDSLGNGGLVENGLEQKEKLEEVALSTPTGNFKSRYAKLESLLKKSSKT